MLMWLNITGCMDFYIFCTVFTEGLSISHAQIASYVLHAYSQITFEKSSAAT